MRYIQSKKIRVSILSSLLLLSSILIFGPFTIYYGNVNSFDVPLISILGYLVVPMVLGMIIFISVGIKLSEEAHQRYIVIVSSIGVLVWLQGNFLVWDYGVLDGSTIDWTKYSWQGWMDGVIWIVFIGFAAVGYRRAYRYAMLVISIILISQLATVCVRSYQQPKVWSNGFSLASEMPEEVFQFSTKQNIIHIILDQFGTPLFEEILKNNEHYLNDLQGFTFFKEVITSTPVTYLSIPSYLSGQVYKNEISVHEFYKQNYLKHSIHTVLSEQGYEVDVMTQSRFYEKRDSDKYFYKIPKFYSTNATRYNAAFLTDLVLFRSFPHYLKKYIYNNQSWLFSSFFLSKEYFRYDHFSGNAFLQNIADNATINRKQPVYKYIHVLTPHPPLVVGEDGEFPGQVLPKTQDNFRYQAEYTLKNAFRILDRLKSLELYDSALIIIHSDHGSGLPFEMESSDGKIISSSSKGTTISSEAFLPLLLIKPPHHKGPLRTSFAQGELADIPATISSILNIQQPFPGQSLFKIDPHTDRERKAYYSSTTHRNNAMISGYFNKYQEYVVTGSVFKDASWKKGRFLTRLLQPYKWGSTLQFRKQGNVLPYLQSGWARPGEERIFNNGKNASIKLGITETEADMIELKAQISPVLFPAKGIDKQRVKININGTPVGEWLLVSPGKQVASVLFQKRLLSNTPFALVNFSFPDAVIPSQIGGGKDQRMLSLGFHAITLKDDFKPYPFGTPISFNKEGMSDDIVVSGWGVPEKKYRWTLGNEASIRLRVDQPTHGKLVLRVLASPYLARGKIDHQQINVIINGREAAIWNLRGFRWFEAPIPASLIGKDGFINVIFKIRNPAAPADFGVSPGRRKLGMAVRELVIDSVH